MRYDLANLAGSVKNPPNNNEKKFIMISYINIRCRNFNVLQLQHHNYLNQIFKT